MFTLTFLGGGNSFLTVVNFDMRTPLFDLELTTTAVCKSANN